MKTKPFKAETLARLTRKINVWLEVEGHEVVQISHAVETDDYEREYSAIVLYKVKEEEKGETNEKEKIKVN